MTCLRSRDAGQTCKQLEEQGLSPDELCANCANDFRADLGQAALDAFAEASGTKDDMGYTDEVPTILTDLLADLMHYCRREGLEFAAIMQQAQAYHADEVAA
ncbi:MAG TPA: hypothetical protein VKY85_07725 [Candidatus Angelobacter sp.]|nr:hypothetical protein [Candidatus Angelobacter sp.]